MKNEKTTVPIAEKQGNIIILFGDSNPVSDTVGKYPDHLPWVT